jgi:hypothetical protein
VGEKGNLPMDNPIAALEAIPLDALKGSPETVNAWMDTYLKYREVRELRRAAEAAEMSAEVARTAADQAASEQEPDTPAT